MAQVRVRVKSRGIDDLGERFKRSGLTQAAQMVEREAKRLCPVKTGNLRRSITHEVGGKGKRVWAIVKATAFYSAYVEYGTSRNEPKPFLRPALRVLRKR